MLQEHREEPEAIMAASLTEVIAVLVSDVIEKLFSKIAKQPVQALLQPLGYGQAYNPYAQPGNVPMASQFGIPASTDGLPDISAAVQWAGRLGAIQLRAGSDADHGSIQRWKQNRRIQTQLTKLCDGQEDSQQRTGGEKAGSV